ncbi:MAG TPA: DUF4142 domain-containing protein [Kineosporiaceae bacterium]
MPRARLARLTLATTLLTLAVSGLAGLAPAASASAAATPDSADRTWMIAAHQGNLAEIAAGRSALQRSPSGEVRRIGQMFITDHSRLDSQLTAVAQQLAVTLPSAPSPAQREELAVVESHPGSAYDSAWLAAQTVAHRATLVATQQELSTGTAPSVLALARATTPVVQKHLIELQNAAGSVRSVKGGTGGQAATASSAPVLLSTVGALLILAAGVLGVIRRRRGAVA